MWAKIISRYVLVPVAVVFALNACQTGGPPRTSLKLADEGTFAFPGVDNYWKGNTSNLSGTLLFPNSVASNVKLPLMVILHGSSGQDFRDSTWSDFLNENGIATFQLDYFSGRGLSSASRGGPETPADVYSALRVLKTHPRIDASKISIMGFSRGGMLTLRAVGYDTEETGGVVPAAFIAIYPGCGFLQMSKDMPDQPILILNGEEDTRSSANQCRFVEKQAEELGKNNIKIVIYPGVAHGFDGNKMGTVHDGTQTIFLTPSGTVTEAARKEVIQLLKKAYARGA